MMASDATTSRLKVPTSHRARAFASLRETSCRVFQTVSSSGWMKERSEVNKCMRSDGLLQQCSPGRPFAARLGCHRTQSPISRRAWMMTASRVETASPAILTASSGSRVAIASGRLIFKPRSASSPASFRASSLSCVRVLSLSSPSSVRRA